MSKFPQSIVNALAKTPVPAKAWPWIVSQSAHETNNWQSSVFKVDNNGFGMKLPKVRPTTAIGPGKAAPVSEGQTPYARYKSLEDSTRDLTMWLYYNKVNWDNINNESDYAAFLKNKGFFGDTLTNYINGMRYWLSRLNIPTKAAAAGGAALLAVAAFFF